MQTVNLTLSCCDDNDSFDLRAPADEVCCYVADVVGPLLEALGTIYSPATLALVLDIAAKSASYAAADAAPCHAAALQLVDIIETQRDMLRDSGRTVFDRPLTAELMW